MVTFHSLGFLCAILARICLTAKYEVVHLTEYMRHGARTTWNNHLNLSITQNLGQGNITANGMRMHFVLGSQLRKNYPSIFNQRFDPYSVEIQSSSVYRCIMSAMSHLLGMFPLGTGDQFTLTNGDPKGLPPFDNLQVAFSNSSALPLAYRPFPYEVISQEIDYKFFPTMFQTCPNAQDYANKLTSEKQDKYAYLVKSIADRLAAAGFDGQKLYGSAFDVNTVALLYDEFKSYFNYYGSIYPGISADLYHDMYLISNLNFKFLFADEKMERFMSDAIARDILAGIERAVKGQSRLKFRMFSGHDTGVWNHMLRYGLVSEQCILDKIVNGSTILPCKAIPEFASSFIYELAQNADGHYFVRVLLNGKPFHVCEKDDDFFCTFEDFKQAMSSKLFYLEDDLVDFCGNPLVTTFTHNNSDHRDLKIALYIAVGVLLINFILIALLVRLTSKAQDRKSKAQYRPVIDQSAEA